MQIVFASNNEHKRSEISAIMADKWQILSLEDVGFKGEIPETGKTIKENSEMKAQFVRDFLLEQGLDYAVFADDSGLEVAALSGAPGVDSAMYAGKHGDHAANNKKLLAALYQITNRKARFVTIITLIKDNKKEFFEGDVLGTIAYEARGIDGFGYDPLFIPRGFRSTFAELGADVKNQVSHRALAVKQLANYLNR
jgi:XTP/dITP diphosphohydrolase